MKLHRSIKLKENGESVVVNLTTHASIIDGTYILTGLSIRIFVPRTNEQFASDKSAVFIAVVTSRFRKRDDHISGGSENIYMPYTESNENYNKYYKFIDITRNTKTIAITYNTHDTIFNIVLNDFERGNYKITQTSNGNFNSYEYTKLRQFNSDNIL